MSTHYSTGRHLDGGFAWTVGSAHHWILYGPSHIEAELIQSLMKKWVIPASFSLCLRDLNKYAVTVSSLERVQVTLKVVWGMHCAFKSLTEMAKCLSEDFLSVVYN